MNLPFTADQFLNVFQRYNTAVWPLQFLFVGLALASAALAWTNYRYRTPAVLAWLAALWLWMGIVYHGVFFRVINPAAVWFATLFVVQGLLLLAHAAHGRRTVSPALTAGGIAGLVFVAYALVVYPLIGYVLGHRYPQNPTFGLPCPTTIFTLGILLWLKPLPASLFVIPVLWSVLGVSAALQLGILEDIGLLMAGLVSVVLIARERRSVRRLTAAA